MKTVYLDVFFFLNLCMDFILILIEMSLYRDKSSVKRVCLAAFTGALMSLPSAFGLAAIRLICLILTPVIIIRILWPRLTKRSILIRAVVFMTVSYFFSGFLNWWYYDICCARLTTAGILAVSLAAGGIIICMLLIGKRIGEEKNTMFQVLLYVGGRTIVTKGFLDSGNLLKDSAGRAVNIVEKEVIFGKNMSEITDEAWCDEVMRYSFRLPYRSLGGDGYITVICVDRMVIPGLGEDLSNVLIGLYDGQLFQDGKCHMLLNGSLLNRGR